jgi:hypothetical protein
MVNPIVNPYSINPLLTPVRGENTSVSVLPCHYNEVERETYYLIGKEAKGQFAGLWNDFGGKKRKQERPSQAAIRELHEETLGAFPQVEKNILHSLKGTFKVQVGDHILYISSLDIGHDYGIMTRQLQYEAVNPIRKNHSERFQQSGLALCQQEKCEMAWIKASELFAVLPANGSFDNRIHNFKLYETPEKNSLAIENQKIRNCMGRALSQIKIQIDKTGEHLNSGFTKFHGMTISIKS